MANKETKEQKENQELETLLEWQAPERVFVKKEPKDFRMLFQLLAVVSLVAVFFKYFLLVPALAALAFVSYMLGTRPPEKVKHKITNKGVSFAGHTYNWDELREFWVETLRGTPVLYVETKARFPGRLVMVIDGKDKDKVVKSMSKYLTYRELPETTAFGRWIESVAEKLSLR